MKISRITKVRERGVFKDFSWPESLLPFARFNMIYGWNGAGKTTLSVLFRLLQDRQAITKGSVEFELDETTKLQGKDIPSQAVPHVRVFNRDFVTAAILAAGSKMDPIYFLGEDSVEKSKEVEKLKKELSQCETAVTDAQTKKKKAEDAADAFCIGNAKLIKEVLTSARNPGYNNYDKRRFKQAMQGLSDESYAAAKLSDEEKEQLQKQKNATPKSAVKAVIDTLPKLGELRSRAIALLDRSVLSETLSELTSDPAVGTWVQRGLALHSGEHNTDTCRFCGQKLSAKRRRDLEAHFSDALAHFQRELDESARGLQQHQTALAALTLPPSSDLYEHLHGEWADVVAHTSRLIDMARKGLRILQEALLRKKDAPFETVSLPSSIEVDSLADAEQALSALITSANTVIAKHNSIASDFQSEVDKACATLERSYVADAYEEHTICAAEVTKAGDLLETASRKPGPLRARIDELERAIREHRRPAEELNAELKAYLGRHEIRFEVKEAGYALTRSGLPAHDLSEGERTAIAFLYFLKSLQDKSFDLEKGVVVVDDPVSSLDANALFSAFGYMKERTKNAGQLFVLTHNFAFFRQIKNWFHHLPNRNAKDPARRPARFFLLRAVSDGGSRSAVLGQLDPLLEEYESEYHYLFKRVHEEASRLDTEQLEQYYGMPNVARRLLEYFLSFRYPDCSSDLHKRMERIDFDSSKKTRILRLLHTYSHSSGISEPEHDPSVLSETRPVLAEILEMIKTVDELHYRGMVKAVAPRDTAEEG